MVDVTRRLPDGATDAIDMTADPFDRYYKDCVGTPPRLPAIRHLIGILIITTIGSLYYFIPAAYLVTIVGSLYYRNTYCIVGLATLIFLSVIPAPQSDTARNHWLLRTMAEYFNVRWIEDTPINTFSRDTRYIACWVPHGIIPFGGLAAGSLYDAISPGYYGRVAMQPILFSMPLLRQLFALYNGVPNDARTLTKTLTSGTSVSIWTGGIAELFLSSPSKEVLYLKSRKGFVKLALKTGSHICPYYTFGNNHMFSSTNADDGQHGMLSKMSRRMGASIVFFWGRWGLPIARQTDVLIVRGRNIHVAQVDNPSQKQIDDLHTTVVDSVKTLFEKYKHLHEPSSNKTLVIQ